jgi:hypothetical protein
MTDSTEPEYCLTCPHRWPRQSGLLMLADCRALCVRFL